MEIKEWLGTQLGVDIWENKYQYNNETFEEWLDRVSAEDEEVKGLIRDKKFLFGGRILAGRGLEKNVCYSNCFVLPMPEDNIESIFDTAKAAARTYSYGGGCGFSLSKLRPRGMKVNNAARTTTGSVSFMDLYSMVTGIIGQGNRTGALMLSLDVSHPDIEEFIDVKNDLDKVTKANISVMINDDFMKAVEENKDWELYFKTERGDEFKKTVNAKDLFRKIAKNNYDTGEPGQLFIDRVNNWNLTKGYDEYKIVGTNPCLHGDTLIRTTDGLFAIKDLVGTQPDVFCMGKDGKLEIRKATKVWKTKENAELVKVIHCRGEIICTPDHKIYTTNRGWVEAKDLRPKDKLNGLGMSMKNERYVKFKLTTDTKYHSAHRFILGHYENIKGKDVHHLDENPLNNVISNLQALEHGQHSLITNIGHEEYCRKSSIDGKFISGSMNRHRDNLSVNKEHTGKNFIVQEVIKLDYTADVYDMTVPEVHNFIANDIIVHNCGEQPLSEYASCLLGSLNLSEFVDDPFTDKAKFNEKEFIRAVHVVVRAMDDVLDENIDRLPLQEQRDKSRNWRQIGLGHLGLADTLIKLQMTYGDEDSLKFSDRIGKIFINECIRASALLAKERGVFPKYNYQSLLQSDFYQKNIDDDVKKLVEEYGMRHCSITSIAPTGSIGTMLAASTGIEPNFRFTYIRKTESMGQEDRYYKVHSKIVKDYLEVTNGDEDNLPEYFIESQNIKPLNRIKMQSTWQKYIDTAISSTINLPEETTIEEIENIYMNAWKYGLKGITVFRDNCKRVGILSTKENEDTVELKRGQWKSLAEDTYYVKRSVKIGCGRLKLFIGYSPSEQTIQDLYIVQSGKGGCTKNLQALAITISAVLRIGGNLDQLYKAYSGIEACNSFVRARAKGEELSKGTYCGSAILNEVKEFLKEMNTEKKTVDVVTKKTKDKPMTKEDLLNNDLCPECKTPLDHAGSCVQCPNCGYSKCN